MKNIFLSIVSLMFVILIMNLTAFTQIDRIKSEKTFSPDFSPTNMLLNESFDDTTFPPDGWQNIQLTGTGLWARTTAGIYPPCSPHSGAGMAYYDNYNFGYDVSAMLVTHTLVLPAGIPKNVNFWMYRDNGWPTYQDSLAVYYNATPDLNGAIFLGKVERYYWMSDWYEFNFPIPASVSGSYYVIFKANSNWGNDIFLDDIEIRALFSDDVGVTSIISPSAMVIAGDVIIPEVIVKNFGIQPQSNIPVRYKNGQTGQVLTQVVPFLDSAATANVVFPSWTASVGGPYDFIFYTDLPGDEDRSNDSLSKPVICSESTQYSSHSIAGGIYHSLSICNDKTVKAWGRNSDGQLGDGTNNDSNTPVQVGNLTDVIRVSAGKYHSVALKEDGTVWCFGNNSNGQLGNGGTVSSNIPVQVSGLANITYIAAGADHTLAIRGDNTVWAWGGNSWGQLGNGTTTGSEIPVQVTGISTAVAIAAGEGYSMTLMNDGTVMAWGANQNGQLGNGTLYSSNVPVLVSGLTDVIEIATGTIHSLALKNDGTLWAWGYNYLGQLGNGTNTDSRVPVQVTGLNSVTVISAGDATSYAVRYDGTAWSWGWNSNGQLGNGTTINSNLPLQVTGLIDMISIAGGGFHCLSIDQEGGLFSWGANDYGQLGNGTNIESHVPVLITGLCPVYSSVNEVHHGTGISMSIFPNPSEGNFIVQIPKEYLIRSDVTIQIYNSLGEKVYFRTFSPNSSNGLNFSVTTKGVFFIRVEAGEEAWTGKAIIR